MDDKRERWEKVTFDDTFCKYLISNRDTHKLNGREM